MRILRIYALTIVSGCFSEPMVVGGSAEGTTQSSGAQTGSGESEMSTTETTSDPEASAESGAGSSGSSTLSDSEGSELTMSSGGAETTSTATSADTSTTGPVCDPDGTSCFDPGACCGGNCVNLVCGCVASPQQPCGADHPLGLFCCGGVSCVGHTSPDGFDYWCD